MNGLDGFVFFLGELGCEGGEVLFGRNGGTGGSGREGKNALAQLNRLQRAHNLKGAEAVS